MPAQMDGVMPSATFEELCQRYGVMPVSGGQQTEEELAKAAEDAAAKAKADDEAKAKEESDELTKLGVDEKSREVIRKERDARKDAANRAKAAEAELATFRAAEAQREADAKKAAEADAVAKGEFEKLATERGESLAKLTAERDDVKGKYDAAMIVITPMVETAWKDLPDEVSALYAGAADDVLAKFAHIERTKQLVERLAGTARNGRISPTPRPNGRPEVDDERAKQVNASRYTG